MVTIYKRTVSKLSQMVLVANHKVAEGLFDDDTDIQEYLMTQPTVYGARRSELFQNIVYKGVELDSFDPKKWIYRK